MPGLDQERPFVPVNIAILTVSDTRTLETDASGTVLVERAEAAGHFIIDRKIIIDDAALIESQLQEWISNAEVDCVISTGGTGVTGEM